MISRSEDSITVSWQKYQYSGDTEISKYIVMYRPRGGGTRQRVNVSISPTEYTLSGLSRNTEYNISVIVVMTDETEGLPSEYSRIRTCGCKYFRFIHRKIMQEYHDKLILRSQYAYSWYWENAWRMLSVANINIYTPSIRQADVHDKNPECVSSTST